MTVINLDYQYCVGVLTFAPESKAQIDRLQAMARECAANELYVYALDDGPQQAVIDVDYSTPGEFSSAICFLSDAAPIIHETTGEIECAVPEDAAELSWHYYRIHDNRLFWQAATFVRHPREVVTAIVPADWRGIQIIGYQGILHFPDLSEETAAEVNAFVQQAWRTKSLQNGHIDFSYYGGKDFQRWYVLYLMGLAEVIGPGVAVRGEIVCSMERMIDANTFRDEFEIYGIEDGHVYRHRGHVDRDEIWVAVDI